MLLSWSISTLEILPLYLESRETTEWKSDIFFRCLIYFRNLILCIFYTFSTESIKYFGMPLDENQQSQHHGVCSPVNTLTERGIELFQLQ